MTLTTHGPGRTRSASDLQELAERAGENGRRRRSPKSSPGRRAPSASRGRCRSMAGDTVLPTSWRRPRPASTCCSWRPATLRRNPRHSRRPRQRHRHNVIDITPSDRRRQDAEYGPSATGTLCCQLRKVDPINAELAGYEAWVTGIRREDNALRANARVVEWDAAHEMVKVNPIAAWSFDDLLDYAGANSVPVNLLLTDGYPSIGCAPCTRRVEPGEDPRAGRWAGLAKTECGLHL